VKLQTKLTAEDIVLLILRTKSIAKDVFHLNLDEKAAVQSVPKV